MFEVENKTGVFLELFGRIKEAETGKKTRIKDLKEAEKKHLRRIVRTYDFKEIEEALLAMFKDPDKWAIKTKNDTPLHFLRNFERYLESAESMKPKPKQEATEENGGFDDQKEWLRKCRLEYMKSLKNGTWLGVTAETIPICKDVAEGVDELTKKELWYEAQRKSKQIREKFNNREPKGLLEIAKFELSEPQNIYGELIVKKGVELKFLPKWNF